MDALMLGSVNVNDGITYWLADGYDPGVGPVELANVESLLDGDRLAGGRTGNRDITLPIVVVGTSRLALARAVAALSTQADQAQFTLTHSPEDGLPVVFDCFRGTVTRQSAFLTEKTAFIARLTVSCQALPFARNPEETVRSVTSTTVQIDACDSLTVPGTVNAGVTLDTTSKAEGTASLFRSNAGTAFITRTFTTSQNLSTYQTVSFSQRSTGQSMTLTLTDTAGKTSVYTVMPGSSATTFVRVSVPLASPASQSAGFNMAAVASYKVEITTANPRNSIQLWVDNVRGADFAVLVDRVVRVAAVQGSARTPINTMTLTAPSGTHKQVLIARWNDQPSTFTPLISAGTGTPDTLASDGTAQSSSSLDVPIVSANFRPGTFGVYALVRNTGAAGTITVQSRVTADNTSTGTLRYGSRTVSTVVASNASYLIYFFGELELPALPVVPTNTAARTFVRFSGISLFYDEIYLLPSDADIAFLSGLNDAVVRLVAEDGTVNAYAGATEATLVGASDRQVAQGSLLLRPGDNDILVVDNAQATGGPISPTISMGYHERYHFERSA